MKYLVLVIAMWVGLSCYGQRIAISQDGNYHDRDDICDAGISAAELSRSGEAGKVVYWGYCDHYWLTHPALETAMHDSVEGGCNRFGGYSRVQFYNVVREHDAALAALRAAINASNAVSPLHVLANGPMQLVGQALAASNVSARQWVTVYSQSLWNDNHATQAGPNEGLPPPRYNFTSLGNLGAQHIHIRDQNNGLNNPYSAWTWLRDSADPDMRWLWSRGQVAGKSTFDCSGAGLIYFFLTGDQYANPKKIRALIE